MKGRSTVRDLAQQLQSSTTSSSTSSQNDAAKVIKQGHVQAMQALINAAFNKANTLLSEKDAKAATTKEEMVKRNSEFAQVLTNKIRHFALTGQNENLTEAVAAYEEYLITVCGIKEQEAKKKISSIRETAEVAANHQINEDLKDQADQMQQNQPMTTDQLQVKLAYTHDEAERMHNMMVGNIHGQIKLNNNKLITVKDLSDKNEILERTALSRKLVDHIGELRADMSDIELCNAKINVLSSAVSSMATVNTNFLDAVESLNAKYKTPRNPGRAGAKALLGSFANAIGIENDMDKVTTLKLVNEVKAAVSKWQPSVSAIAVNANAYTLYRRD